LSILSAVYLAADPAPGNGLNVVMLVFLAGMIVVMWFMSRRTRKQQQEQGDFRRSLEAGQRVMTVGGMIGTVTELRGDVVTLMSPSGDESAYVRRAIKSLVPDEEWEALTAPYPVDEDETVEEDGVEPAPDTDGETGLEVADGPEEDEPEGKRS
jgi:preprotein translocase subunit YajC